jgi:hypothetical protein
VLVRLGVRDPTDFAVLAATGVVAADLGPERQVGHSYFMVPGLDEARLRVVWEHHVGPLLAEYFAAVPGRAAAYALDALLKGRSGHPRRRTAATGNTADA